MSFFCQDHPYITLIISYEKIITTTLAAWQIHIPVNIQQVIAIALAHRLHYADASLFKIDILQGIGICACRSVDKFIDIGRSCGGSTALRCKYLLQLIAIGIVYDLNRSFAYQANLFQSEEPTSELQSLP